MEISILFNVCLNNWSGLFSKDQIIDSFPQKEPNQNYMRFDKNSTLFKNYKKFVIRFYHDFKKMLKVFSLYKNYSLTKLNRRYLL